MPTETEVVNSALGLLASRRITSLDDGSELATLARLRWAIARDAVNEAHPWNFADLRATLVASARVPAYEWSTQYPLPTLPKCLAVRETSLDQANSSQFPNVSGQRWVLGYDSQDGRVIFCNATALSIRYTAQILDLNIWSPLAILALTYLLASDLAIEVTGEIEKQGGYLRSFQATMEQAMSSDARQASPVRLRASTLLTGRR